MRITVKGQVTIPQKVREDIGIIPSQTEIEFVKDKNGRWYLKKTAPRGDKPSRFRRAHKAADLRMSTDEIMALTRAG